MSKFKFLLYSFVFYIIEFIIMGTQPGMLMLPLLRKFLSQREQRKKNPIIQQKKIEKKLIFFGVKYSIMTKGTG